MAIHIENLKNYILSDSDNSKVHSIPFKINADCDAKVTKYFESSIKTDEDKSKISNVKDKTLIELL